MAEGWGRRGTRALLENRRQLLLGALCMLGTACGERCPTSKSPADVADWEAALRAKTPLSLNYASGISVKRDLHDVYVDVEVSRYATAFHQVMIDPERRFGLIRVDRLHENVGKPFTEGEHFQGRYDVEAAIKQQLPGKAKQWFGEFADTPEARAAICSIENADTSDYGVIAKLQLSPAPGQQYVLEYHYLSGSPIAGSSRFELSSVSDAALLAKYGVTQATRVRQIFEYQELHGSFADFFTKGGLRLHDQVVFSQAQQAAEAAGGRVLDSDIPSDYRAP
jgi:hypothetical protein